MKTNFTHRFLVLSFITLLSSCEQEPLVHSSAEQAEVKEQEAMLISQFEDSFDLTNFKDSTRQIKNNIKVDWSKFRTKSVSQRLWYEFKVTEKQPTSYENRKIKGRRYTLLATKHNNTVKFYLNKMLSYSDDGENTYFGIERNKFHGMVYLYNMEGTAEYIMYFKKGKRTSGIEHLETAKGLGEFIGQTAKEGCQLKISTRAKYCERDSAYECALGMTTGPDCNATLGGYLPLTTHYYTDWYNKRGSYYDYSYTQYRGRSTEYIWVSRGGSSVNQTAYSYAIRDGSGGVSYARNSPNGASRPPKVIMDPSMKGTKALCVFEKLQSINGGLFKRTIGKFIDDPQYNLTFKVGDCGSWTSDACTDSNDINNIVITIEDINQSSLGIAALIIHEGIHAEIHRYVSRYEARVDPNNRKRLFELYAFYKGWADSKYDGNYNWKGLAHHNYMVENYVEQIAGAIRQLDGYRYPLENYMSYGWDGLRKYGYTAKRLTRTQDALYNNLRLAVNTNTKVCK